MRRFVALVCLMSVLTATGVSSTVFDEPKVPEPYVPAPKILSPQPGDTAVSSDVLVTGSTMCGAVVLWVDPPGMYYDVTPDPLNARLWTHKVTGVTVDTKLKACCKSTTHPSPPHGPCSLETLVKHPVALAGALKAAVPSKAKAVEIPTYRRGRIDLSGPVPYDPAGAQSVYVVLENEDVLNPRCDRSQAATAELVRTDEGVRWSACFTRVSPGIYVVRAFVISRSAEPRATSHVIQVVP